MKTYEILVLPGDGIGPEVTREALAVLSLMAKEAELSLDIQNGHVGGASLDACGEPITQSTLDQAKRSDAVLLGAVGGPRYDNVEARLRPERGLLALREAMQVYANLRPARLFSALPDACPLKPEVAANFDFVVVRELIGGIYFGKPRGIEGKDRERVGFNTMRYSVPEIERIGRVAFESARLRSKRVMSVDKANVLEVQSLWRQVMTELAKEYPDVALEHMYVDNCAMQLVLNPSQFDVIVTGNLFGDILSDAAGAITGSIGLLPSASLGEGAGLYEPVHGSAPDIAGQGKANPLAAILSVAMMFEHSLKRKDLAERIVRAVDAVLNDGLRTADIARFHTTTECRLVSTEAMGQAVRERLSQ